MCIATVWVSWVKNYKFINNNHLQFPLIIYLVSVTNIKIKQIMNMSIISIEFYKNSKSATYILIFCSFLNKTRSIKFSLLLLMNPTNSHNCLIFMNAYFAKRNYFFELCNCSPSHLKVYHTHNVLHFVFALSKLSWIAS